MKVADGKHMGKGKNRLERAARINMQKIFRKALRGNIRPETKNEAEVKDGISNMRRAVMAGLYHSCILDDDEIRHQFFCQFMSSTHRTLS